MRFAIRPSITLLLKLRSITNSSFGTRAAKSALVRLADGVRRAACPLRGGGEWWIKCSEWDHARPRCSPKKSSRRARERAVSNVGIENVGCASGAGYSPGWGAGLLAFWCGPGMDKPFLHNQWVVIALASLVCSCNRSARILSRLEQVAGNSEG